MHGGIKVWSHGVENHLGNVELLPKENAMNESGHKASNLNMMWRQVEQITHVRSEHLS